MVESARHEKRSEKNVGRYFSYFGIGHRVLYGRNINLWFQTKTSINHFKMNIMCNWLVVPARHEKRAKRNTKRTNLSYLGIGHRVMDGQNIIF